MKLNYPAVQELWSDHPDVVPVQQRPELVSASVAKSLFSPADETSLSSRWPSAEAVGVMAIDAELADTAAFCQAYNFTLAESANCVVVSGTRSERTTLAACVVLATTRADVNGLIRRRLDARRASFAALDAATQASGMEYGGITPIGIPGDWKLFIDQAVAQSPRVVIGAGLRGAKLLVPGALLTELPGAEVVADLGRPIPA